MKIKNPPSFIIVMLLFNFSCSAGNSNGSQQSNNPEKKPSIIVEETIADKAIEREMNYGKDAHIDKAKQKRLKDLAGKIDTAKANNNMDLADESLGEFLSVWEPVGRKIDELIEYIGKPDRVNGSRSEYIYDSGYGGWRWVFGLSDGEIKKVTRIGIN